MDGIVFKRCVNGDFTTAVMGASKCLKCGGKLVEFDPEIKEDPVIEEKPKKKTTTKK